MRCDEVTALLAGTRRRRSGRVRGRAPRRDVPALPGRARARYRRLLRTLSMLRTRYVEPTPGLLGETLAAITEAAEHGARPDALSGRRLAYAGAIGGSALAAGATAAVLIARSRRRALSLAG